MVNCKRCGQCCYYVVDGIKKKCKWLVLHGNLTSCRIFIDRLGTIIFHDGNITVRCTLRIEHPLNYAGCPYNKVNLDKK